MNYSDQIKSLRLSLGLNKADFAKKIGASPTSINDWEFGRHKPGAHFIKILVKLAQENEYKSVGHG